MAYRGITVSGNFFATLVKELMENFSKNFSIDLKTLTVFQLYGFGNYDENKPNLKTYIIEKTGKWINGKYLYNKKREIENKSKRSLSIRKDYLSLLIETLGYNGYTNYLKESPYITEEVLYQEEKNINSEYIQRSLYYVGYYVEDKQFYIKSKFTINQMETASWEIFYQNGEKKPIIYSYDGKCIPTGDSALSFYFKKEDSSLNKECFINLFYGNQMQKKPILLGAYCGFDRNNNPVIGKIIFEQVANKEIQEKEVIDKNINPIFYNYLYSQRICIEGILPYESVDLDSSKSRSEITDFLIGDYYGLYLEKNDYLIPLVFKVINFLCEIELKLKGRYFKGIGRINSVESHLISEFSGKHDYYSTISLQIDPLKKNLFLGHILIFIGGNVLNGKILLWKGNNKIKKLVAENNQLYLTPDTLSSSIINEINEFL